MTLPAGARALMEGRASQWPDDFGSGWMSRNAIDLARIMIVFGGFDPMLLGHRLAFASCGRTINCATVERLVSEMAAEHREGLPGRADDDYVDALETALEART